MAYSSLKGMHKQLKESQAVIEESLEADDNNSKTFAESLAQCIKDGQNFSQQKCAEKTAQYCDVGMQIASEEVRV
jgi:hypothetical protein